MRIPPVFIQNLKEIFSGYLTAFTVEKLSAFIREILGKLKFFDLLFLRGIRAFRFFFWVGFFSKKSIE